MHTDSGAWQKFDIYLSALIDQDSRIKILLKLLRQRDPKLFEHCKRVAHVCFGFVSHLSRMGVITRRKELVRNLFVLCGLLHDFGMRLMHHEITEKFSDEKSRDFFVRRFHPFFSYDTLLMIHPDIADIVYFHHRTSFEKLPKSLAGPDGRLSVQHYDPLTDASVIFPITFLTTKERQELCRALAVIEYFVENIIEKNVSIGHAVFEKISSIFPNSENALEVLRALFAKNPAPPAPSPILKKI